MNIEQLSRALKSTLNAQVVKFKLTKKHGACLTVEITQVSSNQYLLLVIVPLVQNEMTFFFSS